MKTARVCNSGTSIVIPVTSDMCLESESDEGEKSAGSPASTTDAQRCAASSRQIALEFIRASSGTHAKADLASLSAWGQASRLQLATAVDGVGSGPASGRSPSYRGKSREGYRRS
jgi:hypothetical protein